MTQLPGAISGKNFKAMLSKATGKTYLSHEAEKSLKKGGLSGLLYKKNISKEQALKAVNILKKKGEAVSAPASELWQRASVQQQKENLATEQAVKQKHILGALKQDIAEQLAAEEKEREQEILDYKSKKIYGKLSDVFEAERKEREEKIAKQRRALQTLYNPPKVNRPIKPQATEEPPDIFSGLD